MGQVLEAGVYCDFIPVYFDLNGNSSKLYTITVLFNCTEQYLY